MKKQSARLARRQGELFQTTRDPAPVTETATARPVVEALADLLLEASGHARRREEEADELEDQT